MDRIARYLERRATLAKRPLTPSDTEDVGRVVVIPALRERASLPDTLAFLAANPSGFLAQTLVICVVNNAIEADEETRTENAETLRYLHNAIGKNLFGPVRIASIDASTPGNELAAKEGVGAARKIGMDWAAEVLRTNPKNAIICLDADTRVDANYLSEMDAHFNANTPWAAVVAFAHPIEGTPREQEAIVWYETFLRYWTLGLRYAGSPYAYHSVGSAMACTVEAYASVGGMNRRQAGEDFYFLQELAKSGDVGYIRKTVVRPSARASNRVPFGTGRRMSELLAADSESLAYNPRAFEVLREWIAALRTAPASSILTTARAIAPALAEYLAAHNIESSWQKLERNASSESALLRQRHRWFDAFRTLKCLHYLRDNGFPDQLLYPSVATLLGRVGHPWEAPIGSLNEKKELLHRLREIT